MTTAVDHIASVFTSCLVVCVCVCVYVVLSYLPPTPINYNHLRDFKKLPPPPLLTIVYFYLSGAFFHYYYYVLVRPVSVGGVVPASPLPPLPLIRLKVPVPVVFQRTYLAHPG